MTKLQSRWVNSIDPVALQALIEGMDRSNSPAVRLLDIVDEVAREETATGTLSEVCAHIAHQGPNWHGGGEGSIGVRVREHADSTVTVTWGSGDDYTWCGVGELLQAIDSGNRVPEWHEEGWTQVWTPNDGADGGGWVPRQSL